MLQRKLTQRLIGDNYPTLSSSHCVYVSVHTARSPPPRGSHAFYFVLTALVAWVDTPFCVLVK